MFRNEIHDAVGKENGNEHKLRRQNSLFWFTKLPYVSTWKDETHRLQYSIIKLKKSLLKDIIKW